MERILLEIREGKTTVPFESPHRLCKLLIKLKEFCGNEREIQVSRELTKKYEEHLNSNINDVLSILKQRKLLAK